MPPTEMTLYDVDRHRSDETYAMIVDTLQMEADVTQLLSFETLNTTQKKSKVRNALPPVGWRKRGGTFDGGKSGYSYVTDTVYHTGFAIDLDKIDYRDKMVSESYIKSEIDAGVKSMAYELNDVLINGDHAVDEDTPEGLKVRIGNLGDDQTIFAATSTTTVDLRPASTPTNDQLFSLFDAIDDAVYAIDGHKADIVFTDSVAIRGIISAARRLNINVEPIEFQTTNINERATSSTPANKRSIRYGDITFVDMGVKVDQTTKVIPTEDLGDGGASTPMYFVRMGQEYFHGIQEYPLDLTDPFMLNSGLGWRSLVDWPVGFHHVHHKFGSVLRGFQF